MWVTGDASLSEQVANELRQRGGTIASKSKCGVVTAKVERHRESIIVSLTDVDGRTEHRTTDDTAAAATFIESWALHALTDPLLAARFHEPGKQDRDPDRPKPIPEPNLTRYAQPPPPRWHRERADLHVGFDIGFGSDASTWRAIRINGCVMYHDVCVGGQVRLGVDLQITGPLSNRFLAPERDTHEVLLTLDRPSTRGDLEFVPGLGIGLAEFDGEFAEDAQGNDNDDEIVDRGLRVEAHTLVSYKLVGHLRAYGTGALAYSALVPSEQRLETGILPGMPPLKLWIGIGIGYGGW